MQNLRFPARVRRLSEERLPRDDRVLPTPIALQTDRALSALLKRTEAEENEEPEDAEALGECP